MTIDYLSLTEVAALIRVKPTSMARYDLPVPDALIGTIRGWLPATIDTWNTNRTKRN